MTIEIVDFPIKNGGSFHSYVKLPMVIFPLNMVIFPLKMVIFPLKMVIFLTFPTFSHVFHAAHRSRGSLGGFVEARRPHPSPKLGLEIRNDRLGGETIGKWSWMVYKRSFIIYIYICICINIYIYMSVYIYVCVYICIYIYMYTQPIFHPISAYSPWI